MALDIMAGGNLKVSVGTAGTTLATDFKEVPEVAVFTTSGYESQIITVTTFNSAYNRKLLGTKSVPDIELSVNYLADDPVHQQLEKLADDQKRCQIRLDYYSDATHTTGFYVVYNCYVSSTTISGDKDQVIVKAFTLAVDGGALESGVIEA